MASINSSLVPSISPGTLFTRLTEDTSINVRWLTGTDPVYYEVLNRPIADLAIRQLILAKAMDQLDTSMGHVALFPFLIQPLVTNGTSSAVVPIRLFWDMHVSIPEKWKNLRLGRVDRIDGTNGTTYTGTLRFIFVANQEASGSESSIETALFYVDYEIDSTLDYQIAEINPATLTTASGFSVIDPSESETIGGTIIFATGDSDQTEISNFYDFVMPGTANTYDIADTIGGTDSFQIGGMDYGTGLLTSGAYNVLADLTSSPASWVSAFNFPFDQTVGEPSSNDGSKSIPTGLFSEFDICVPASDRPTDDITAEYFPVWLSKIEKISDSPATLVLYFSTYSIEQAGTAVEFASMTLKDTYAAGRIVEIEPIAHLYTQKTDISADWYQEFGRGHAQLSSLWGTGTGGGFDSFFAQFPSITGLSTTFDFSISETRIGAFGLSRIPKYSPTAGQADALQGTTSRWDTPVYPGDTNRYVTEQDEGEGDIVDLDTAVGNSSSAINTYGSMATRSHKLVKLVIDADHEETDFYTNYIEPRLTILLGRAPVFGDMWYQGTRFLTYNGDAWIG